MNFVLSAFRVVQGLVALLFAVASLALIAIAARTAWHALVTGGLLSRLPILLGTVIGYLGALALGAPPSRVGTSVSSRARGSTSIPFATDAAAPAKASGGCC